MDTCKIALKRSKVIKKCNFQQIHQFFKRNVWAQSIPLPPFLKVFLPTFSTFHQIFQLLPLLTDFYTTFTNFYHFLLPSTNFYYLPRTFTNFYYISRTFTNFLINSSTTFHQPKIVLFHFFHVLTFTNPTILLDAMLQVLILSLLILYLPCGAYIYYTKPKI